jgi:hypothetical protein
MEKRKIRIKLSNKFYRKEAVEEALRDFNEVCKGKIISNEIEVELEPEENIENLKEAFCNYVLGLMKNKTLV